MSAEKGAFDLLKIQQRLARFLSAQGLEAVEIDGLRRFTVGFSWMTFGFRARWREAGEARERELILRLGPPNGIFAPYKASTEFVTLRALTEGSVPVPQVHWHSDSSEDFGAPFFICDFVRGEAPIPWTPDGGPAFDQGTRRHLGEQFVAALAALHRFEWRGSGVEGIGGATDVACAAVDRIDLWEGLLRQWSSMRVPMLEWAAIWLRERAPIAPRISVVHGDFRIGNFLVDEGRITAILDWEIVRLGDPVEDVGWICMQAWRGRSPYMCHLFERSELLERYNALTGFQVPDRAVRYWEAFGTYKLAVMHYGARFCFERRGYNDMRMAGMGAQIPRMLLQVETAIERAA
jgi:aminoglycoside phosphotransferase (APT) family kinase protein